jgi:hypothetical protein
MSDKLPPGSESIAPRQHPSINLPLGRLLSTPGAIEAMTKAGQDPLELLRRHRTGDWGEVDEGDSAANDQAVIHGERILSAYTLKNGARLWIITEADGPATTLLLPDEY